MRHFVVSGGGNGIGRALACDLLARGDRVTTIHRNVASAEALRNICGDNDRLRSLVADLRRSQEIAALADPLGSGPAIDGLVNTAGVWRDDHSAFRDVDLADTPPNQIEDVLGVGVQGAMLLTRTVLRLMRDGNAGKIVFVSCGFAGPHEARGWVHYFAANAAIEGLTRGLAAECRKANIQVNCLAPWFVRTEHVQRFFPEDAETALPLDRVVLALRFLLSKDTDDISGQVIDLRSHLDIA